LDVEGIESGRVRRAARVRRVRSMWRCRGQRRGVARTPSADLWSSCRRVL